MKTILMLICTMFMTCASLLNAQNATEEIRISGTLVNPTTSIKEYSIEVRQTGNDNRLLEEIKPEEDGSFLVTVFSDRAVRLVVMDKNKNVVFRRTLVGTANNRKMDLKEIDLSKARTNN